MDSIFPQKLCTKIAVIDDDPDLLELVCAYFRQKNYQTSSYEDPRAFLRDLEKPSTSFDAILTDLLLPNMNGIELTRKIRSIGIHTPIILLTAMKSTERAIEAIEAGAYDFVLKPVHFPQLQLSLERALHFQKLQTENESLKAAVAAQEAGGAEGIIGRSPGLLRALDLAKRVAESSANVFISGETGSGKEVIAKAIHRFGPRAEHPFIAINCSAIPENLLESELFGHAKGSFTGASEKKVGLFEEAGEGTLFLDEIGDLSLPLQSKLLRVLQERRIRRIGENQFRDVHARIISATHKDLWQEVREKRFREDLFFRLNVIPIRLPPLRERREDILPLAEFFLKKFAALNEKKIEGFEKPALEFLLKSPWLGNVRELENSIERAVVLCKGEIVQMENLVLEEPHFSTPENAPNPKPANPPFLYGLVDQESPLLLTLEELTNRYLLLALDKNNGAKDKTARDLGIDRKTLYRRLQEMSQRIQQESGKTVASVRREELAFPPPLESNSSV